MKSFLFTLAFIISQVFNALAYQVALVGSVNDTTIYDLYDLGNKLDRVPEFHLCSPNSIIVDESIVLCIERKLNVDIKSVELKNLGGLPS